MIYLFILFSIFCVTDQWICNFDYGKECIRDLPSASFILLNKTIQQIRQPVSDVTAILTSNDKGECVFPYQLGSFQMYFCEKTDPNLPSICPILNGNGSKMNCTEGEYGYEIFEGEKSGSRSYQLESLPNLSIGDHCIELFYYLSDENSNGSIQVLIEDSQTNKNDTILLTSLYQANKWHQIRQNFRTFHSIFKMFFIFERGSSNSNSFYIGIDQITILDMFCVSEPMTTTPTTENSSTTTMTTDSTMTDKNSIILTSISSTLPTSTVNSVTKITTNMLNTISSTLSMNNTIRVIKNNTTMIPINSSMIILTWNSSSSNTRLSYQIEFNIILILFLFKY